MTKLFRTYLSALALLALMLVGAPAYAQVGSGVPVQQTATKLDAATNFCTQSANAGLVNNAVTATCTPGAGQFVYLTSISFDVCSNATGTVQNNVLWTTTNLTGAPQFTHSFAATANICQHWNVPFATPVKSTVAGTPVTIVSPTGATNNSYNVVATFYSAQ
jgi:hypothetical protein